MVKPAINTPTIDNLLSLNNADRDELKAKYKFQMIDKPVNLSGTSFVAYTCKTPLKCIDNVRAAYKAFLLEPNRMIAAHNALAYKLKGDIQGYADDGSFGIGKTILNTLPAVTDMGHVIFLTQTQPTTIGFKKYDTVRELASKYQSTT